MLVSPHYTPPCPSCRHALVCLTVLLYLQRQRHNSTWCSGTHHKEPYNACRLSQPGPSGHASPLCCFQNAACAERCASAACNPFLMLRALTAVASWPRGLQPAPSKGVKSPWHIPALVFPGAAYSGYSARVEASPAAESLMRLRSSDSHARAWSRGKSGSVCRDSAVQLLCLLTDAHMLSVWCRGHKVVSGSATEHPHCLHKLLRRLVKQRNPLAQNPALGIGINGKCSPKAHKRISQGTLPCIISPLHGQTHTYAIAGPGALSVKVSTNRLVKAAKGSRGLSPSAPESLCKFGFWFKLCEQGI